MRWSMYSLLASVLVLCVSCSALPEAPRSVIVAANPVEPSTTSEEPAPTEPASNEPPSPHDASNDGTADGASADEPMGLLSPAGFGAGFISYHLPTSIGASPQTNDPFAVDLGLGGPTTSGNAAQLRTSAAAPATTAAMQKDPYWGGAGGWSSSIAGAFYHIEGDFRIGDQREDWDRAERWELLFHSREPLHGRVEAMIGGYVYYEEKEWEEDISRVLFDSWGFGIDAGAMLYPLEGANTRKFNIGVMPFFRLGMGFNDGDFRNVDVNLSDGPALSSGSLGNLRFDFSLGAEARAVINRVLFVGLGAGLNWWTTASGAVGTTQGTIIIFDDYLDFHGKEAFFRASVGFFF